MKHYSTDLPQRLTNETHMKLNSRFGVVRQQVKGKWPLHWHEFYEMEYVLSGEGTQMINGVPYNLTRGSLFFMTPADFHEVIPLADSELDLINVKFSDEMLSESLWELLFVCGTPCITEMQVHSVEADFQRLLSEGAQSEEGKEIVIRGTLERILVDLIRKIHQQNIAGGVEKAPFFTPIHRSLIYIQHHFREPLTLEIVAAQSNLSPNYFSGCFHATTGSSFRSYLQKLRLQFAAALLSSSIMRVTEICYTSGFNSLPHFLRAFKRQYGHSPSAYRKIPKQPLHSN